MDNIPNHSFHSYPKVYALGHKEIEHIFDSEVVAQEKVDGSQFSFGLIEGKLCVRSHNKEMDVDAPEMLFQKAVDVVKSLILIPGWTYRGEYLCLSGDTKVKKASGGQNSKYLTLKDLFYLQSKLHHNRTYTRRDTGKETKYYTNKTRWEYDGNPCLYSLDVSLDKVVKNPIERVIHTGEKEVYLVSTRKGMTIKTSLDHNFWTPDGWLPVSALREKSCVGVVDDSAYKVKKINFGLEYKYEFDTIRGIDYIGKEDCYDIEMQGKSNIASFVADGFIVHNCKPKHNALAYDRVPRNHIILFDINTGHEEFMDYDEMVRQAHLLGLEAVPVFFSGRITSFDMLKSLLDTPSILGGQKIEGVVVKNYHRFGRDGHVLMGKLVSEEYKEVHQKEWKDANPGSKDVIQKLIDEYATQTRWNKAVMHLKERGQLEGSPRDIGLLVKEVPNDVLLECRDEIKDKVFDWAWAHIRRGLTKGLAEWYKETLAKTAFDGEETKNE